VLDAAIAPDRDADDHLAGQPAPTRLVGIVEVAHALDPVDPLAQVAGPRVLGGAGRDELALGALGVPLRAQVDLGGEPGHRHVVADLLLARRKGALVRWRGRLGGRGVGLTAGAADHAGLRRWLRRRRL